MVVEHLRRKFYFALGEGRLALACLSCHISHRRIVADWQGVCQDAIAVTPVSEKKTENPEDGMTKKTDC